jgi:pSer/pThr/pTyr-binding forkhead associated (FHA) protein
VYRNDGAVLVQDESRYGTWVNDRRVSGTAELRAGDVLRVGSPGSRMLLVAARD